MITLFHQIALGLIVLWLAAVAIRFRRSPWVLAGGLVALGVFTAAALATGMVSAAALGLAWPLHWLHTVMFALFWTGLMFALSPTADWAASQVVKQEPTLDAFHAIKESRRNLVIGIALAWVLGAVLEELVFRGIVMGAAMPFMGPWFAALLAAIGAGVLHLYQGPRAALIIAQLSFLFGVLYVASGYELWSVILAHGLYDTVAFIRYATGKSKYSRF